MRVIGVIDLKAGVAVHARGGRRDAYAPVRQARHTPVAGDALALARFYRQDCGLDTLYVADLDAIAGKALQRETLIRLASAGDVWLDRGVASLEDASSALSVGVERVIVGLETLPDYAVLERICLELGASRVVLSLDLRGGQILGPPDSPVTRDSLEAVVARARAAGVTTTVVLDLSRVGEDVGPAVREARRVRAAVPEMAVYVGGGIRSVDDLHTLQDEGVAGAFVASALHDGRLTPADLHPILTR